MNHLNNESKGKLEPQTVQTINGKLLEEIHCELCDAYPQVRFHLKVTNTIPSYSASVKDAERVVTIECDLSELETRHHGSIHNILDTAFSTASLFTGTTIESFVVEDASSAKSETATALLQSFIPHAERVINLIDEKRLNGRSRETVISEVAALLIKISE